MVGAGAMVDACGDCVECNRGNNQLCAKKAFTFNDVYKDGRGGLTYGGFADRVRINGEYVYKLPANITPAEGMRNCSLFALLL